jgi:GNAT superfamily N-acetyltransferase
MSEKANDRTSYKFDFITYDQIDTLENTHPLVYNTLLGGAHKPTHMRTLIYCPDIFDEFPFYFYIYDGDKIISSSAMLPDIFFLNESKYRWAWAGALLVDPAYRGHGLGTKIAHYSLEILHERNIAKGGTFSTPTALHIHKKLGYTIPGFADRFLFLKSGKAVFRYHLKSDILAAPADIIYRLLAKSYLKIKGRPIKPEKLGARADEIDFSKININDLNLPPLYYHTIYHFNDSPAKLFWKIRSSKYNSMYLVKDMATEKPLGYFILKNRPVKQPMLDKYKDFNLMTLMDYGVYNSDENIYNLIINLALNIFIAGNADVFEVISSSPIMNGYIKEIGMRKAGKGMSYVYTVPPSWNLGTDAIQIQNWPLTHFCGDAFSFV